MAIPQISNQGQTIRFIVKRQQRQAQYFSEDLGNGVTLEMVAIPGGTFLMGSPETEEGHRDNESPQHRVTVQSFFMGKYPRTTSLNTAVVLLASDLCQSVGTTTSGLGSFVRRRRLFSS
ncbi:hypothetical protein MC7420_5676 [Coleofasciculus chthonoplastes PCC 7420]|uniref:Sulfatase-modifying factor enzyme-like domain-containing protein n=1 Tax=Coleofasciculus chthonoplastes PCC 7420 TaxID=118168 RepID=B4VQ64_9CYAN|nr:SUMF1/EgtB/PvdO family nonheme iron enzyme [Coleofasciculus chthonoplastes]EDX76242.1 hypothetical protein MC7420_5676 [Coleofasciculus chthonoplastes PCC 7420]